MNIPSRLAAAIPLFTLAAVLAGCGVGAGKSVEGVTLTVTEDHGSTVIFDEGEPAAQGEDTVLRLLQRNAKIQTRYSGAYVQSINGLAGGEQIDGQPVDWLYWVDGVSATKGASAWKLTDGDRVWWDRSGAGGTPGGTAAVVGSFPAPLAGGFHGRSPAVEVRCAAPGAAACRIVGRALSAAGVTFATGEQASLPAVDPQAPIGIVVGPAAALAAFGGPEAAALLAGPQRSGVFVAAGPAGGLRPISSDGIPGAPFSPGTGVVAAVRLGSRAPVWFVTGTDDRGVRRAGRALAPEPLSHRLAVAVDAQGARPLPAASR